MSKVVKFASLEDIRSEASEWVARLDRGLNQSEQDALQSWMALSDTHKNCLFEMTKLWDDMDCLARLAALFPEHSSKSTITAKPRYKYAFIAMAASITLAIMATLSFNTRIVNQLVPAQIAQIFGLKSTDKDIYETSIGEYSTVTLTDGSLLTLNTDTLVKVGYNDDSRLLYLLRGEIHIKVSHDKARPLSVMAGQKVVQAVGTAFNVQLTDDKKVELIVTDGKVLVAETGDNDVFENIAPLALPAASLAVSKGEKIILDGGNKQVDKINTIDIEASLSWRQGNIVFSGETLEEALLEIGRYTDVKFHVQDENIKSVRIAGMFKAGDVSGLLIALKENFNIDSDKTSGNIVQLHSI
ncbi:MAG: transmembrane sensor [Flavobacteriales bacterium]|jgi:transmembrane sensor